MAVEPHPEAVRLPERIHPAADQIRHPAADRIRAVARTPVVRPVRHPVHPALENHPARNALGASAADHPGNPVPGRPACAGTLALQVRQACDRKSDAHAAPHLGLRPEFPAEPPPLPVPPELCTPDGGRSEALLHAAQAAPAEQVAPEAQPPPAWLRPERRLLELSLPQPALALPPWVPEEQPVPEPSARASPLPPLAREPAPPEAEPQEPAPRLPPEAQPELAAQPELVQQASRLRPREQEAQVPELALEFALVPRAQASPEPPQHAAVPAQPVASPPLHPAAV